MNKKISTSILALLLGLSSLTAQDLYIEDFSIPICGNGNGQDTYTSLKHIMDHIIIVAIR